MRNSGLIQWRNTERPFAGPSTRRILAGGHNDALVTKTPTSDIRF
jgi:hypothetical protein